MATQLAALCLLLASARAVSLVNAGDDPENKENDCLDVEDPHGAAAEGKAGDRQCFHGDNVGMVCGWDGTAKEAYCELSATGVKVCARSKGGGRCKEGSRTPTTKKKTDAAEAQSETQSDNHDGSNLQDTGEPQDDPDEGKSHDDQSQDVGNIGSQDEGDQMKIDQQKMQIQMNDPDEGKFQDDQSHDDRSQDEGPDSSSLTQIPDEEHGVVAASEFWKIPSMANRDIHASKALAKLQIMQGKLVRRVIPPCNQSMQN
eukprot:gnl/MRDRNA2_/MRDRNA2_32767_c0_seq1.p1 gnl/MRDRNA2_/MRDRNA2_32767_c0~~gnl/MRDRNA2_/MRDRNA2_32767_c0_seq1.p1  ORF type:complete len:258 (+),score=77.18 gnl/MRDRNA2_/MRDRNA2_32767_c0_seq1:102-875(+)